MSDSQAGTETEEIDPCVVARMAEELATARSCPTVEQLFTARNRPAPLVLWSPTEDQLPLEGLRFLLKYWHVARGKDAMPPVGAIVIGVFTSEL